MDYIVDVEQKRLVGNFLSTRSASPGSAVFGDTPDISVRFVEANPNSNAQPWRYIDMAGKSARVAIGQPGALPESGNFTLTFGGDETSNIDFAGANLATAIDSALNALASVTTAGGVTVSEILGGAAFQVDFDAVGAQALITAGTDRLSPSASAVVTETIAGDGTTAESQVIAFERDPGAYIELTTDIADPTVAVSTLQIGVTDTLPEVQRVAFTGDPWTGTYTIDIDGSVTSLLTPTSTVDEIKAELDTTLGTTTTVVTGVPLDYTIQFASSLGNVGTAIVDVTALVGATGKTGSIDLNTNEFYELLGGASTATATLEIVLYDTNNSTSDTIIQQAITCRQDVIPDTPPSQTPVPTYAAQSHTHLEADISDLGTAITLNADDNLTGNAWFFDDDTLGGVDADTEKCASQASVKNYVDNQIAALGEVLEFKGSYDANTTDPTDGGIGDTYVVTVAGTGVASFWTTALEIGDVIIQENDPATTEADWVVVSKDLDAAAIKTLYESNADTNEFSDAEQTTLGYLTATGAINLDTLATDTTTNNGKLTANETNVTAALDGATLTAATVAGTDKVLVQDTDAADELKTVTAQSIADLSAAGTPEGTAVLSTGETVGKLLQADGDDTCSWVAAPSGTPEGTVILSTGETGGTKYLREDGDGTCSWQAVPGGGVATDAIFDAKGDLAGGTGADTAARLAVGTNGQVLKADSGESTGLKWEGEAVEIGIACSDEETALATNTAQVTFRMPYAMTLTEVRANVNTAPTGATIIVDINETGVSVLSTKLSIDASEKTSTTAASAAVISDSALADDAEITIDIDQVGSTIAGKGLKIWLIGTKT